MINWPLPPALNPYPPPPPTSHAHPHVDDPKKQEASDIKAQEKWSAAEQAAADDFDRKYGGSKYTTKDGRNQWPFTVAESKRISRSEYLKLHKEGKTWENQAAALRKSFTDKVPKVIRDNPEAIEALLLGGASLYFGQNDGFMKGLDWAGKGASALGYGSLISSFLSTATSAPGSEPPRPGTTPAVEDEHQFVAIPPADAEPEPSRTITETRKPKDEEERLLKLLKPRKAPGGKIPSRTYHRVGHPLKAGRPKGAKDKKPRKKRGKKKAEEDL